MTFWAWLDTMEAMNTTHTNQAARLAQMPEEDRQVAAALLALFIESTLTKVQEWHDFDADIQQFHEDVARGMQ